MSDQLDKILNEEADRFLKDMLSQAMLAYQFYQTVIETESSDEIHDNLDQLFQDQDYNTDAKHFLPKLSDSMDHDLSLWSGYYRLGGADQSINLVIGAKTSDSTRGKTKAFINGSPLVNYSFKDAVLSWDDTNADEGGTKGELKFSSYFDQQSTGSDDEDYFGPYCLGDIRLSADSESVSVKGKVGVHSPDALGGDYNQTDPLSYWAGQYSLLTPGSEEEDILEINSSEDGEQVIFNDEEIKEFAYAAGALSWKVKKHNHKLNHSLARLKLIENARGDKLISGHIRKSGQPRDGVDSNGIQIVRPDGKGGDLTITTANIGVLSTNKDVSIPLRAAGGKTPYSWNLKSPLDSWGGVNKQDVLPPGLEFDMQEVAIKGKPKEAGIYSVDIMVTDSSSPAKTSERRLNIHVTSQDKGESVEDQVKAWLASPPIAAILGIISGFLIYFFKGKYDEYKEKKKLDSAKEAAKAQLPDLDDLGNAETEEKRREIINRLKEYRAKAVAKIREQVNEVNEVLEERKQEISQRIETLDRERDKPGLDQEEIEQITEEIREYQSERSEIRREQRRNEEQIPPEEGDVEGEGPHE